MTGMWQIDPLPLEPAPSVAMVVARFNREITDRLAQGAMDALAARSAEASLLVIGVPGSMELPAAAAALASSARFDGVVCLGCVIRGETMHDRCIAAAVAEGLTRVSVDERMPVTFGVLTVESDEQAEARAGGAMGNKGADAMNAALDMISVLRQVRAGSGGSVVDTVRDGVAGLRRNTRGMS